MSFCATGSLIDVASGVASLNLRCWISPTTCFTAARSGGSGGAGVTSPALVWSLGRRVLGPGARSKCFASLGEGCLRFSALAALCRCEASTATRCLTAVLRCEAACSWATLETASVQMSGMIAEARRQMRARRRLCPLKCAFARPRAATRCRSKLISEE